MADKIKDAWLKVLIGFIITLLLLSFGFTNGKISKDTFNRHEKYQTEQFEYIKSSLDRIEGKL